MYEKWRYGCAGECVYAGGVWVVPGDVYRRERGVGGGIGEVLEGVGGR